MNKAWCTWRRPGWLRSFRTNDSGATAVEFALVAAPFFVLLFAIIEIALIFFAQQVMDTGVSQAARLIRTGQSQSMDQAQFKQEVCNRIATMFDCEEGLKLDVRTYPTFADIDTSLPIEDGKLKDDSFQFKQGKGGSIVVVRAYYEWPTIVPGLGHDMGNLANGNRLLATATAFRNEPFGG